MTNNLRNPAFPKKPGFYALHTALLLLASLMFAACRPNKSLDTIGQPRQAVAESDAAAGNASVQILTVDGERTEWTQQETLGQFLAEAGIEVRLGERLLADGQPAPPDSWLQMPLPRQIVIDPYKTITIVVDGQEQSLRTAAVTVGEALQDASLTTSPFDALSPPPDTEITPGQVITLAYAAPYKIMVDGRELEVHTGVTRLEDVLHEAGVVLGEMDYTQPDQASAVDPGDLIHVIRVEETVETADEPISYETVYVANPEMDLDTQAFVSAGSPGILRRQTRVRTENGVEVSRQADSEWVEVEPVNEAFHYGTKITVQTMDTPEGPIEYWRVVNMRVTSYTPTSAGKNPGEPGYGITASGVQAGKGVAAVDPKVVPFRSNVYVPGYGVAFAGDTGGGVKGRFIDLGYSDDDYQHWSGFVDVYYLTPVPEADKIRYVLP